VTPAVSAESGYRGETGTVADVISRRVPVGDHDTYVSGSSAMVMATVSRLQSLGVPQNHIYVEDFGWSES
jgi:NAD(P)H-flavin reductase